MNLIQKLFGRKPSTRASLGSHRHEPPAISQTMDAGRISDVLRAAESGDMLEFFQLARDIVSGHGHTLTEFGKRKLAVLAETLSFSASDPEDPTQAARAKAAGDNMESVTSWNQAMIHLLDSTLYPVSVLQKVWIPSTRAGWRYELADLIPVPYHQLDFSTGRLRIRDVGPDGEMLGTSHDPHPLQYVIHRGHLLTSAPDTWGGPMRSIFFWWLFATQDRDWWIRFLERFGAPFIEGSYDKSDDESRTLLEHAFSAATRLFGIVVPDDASVKIHQASATDSGDAFAKFHDAANREISKIIVGQTSSSEIQKSGLGDSQGQAQSEVRSDLRRFDAIMLAATVRNQIIRNLYHLNGWQEEPARAAWGGDDSEDLDTLSQILERLNNIGVALTDEGVASVSKRLALPLERVSARQPALGPMSALAAPTPGVTSAALDSIDRMAAAAAPDLAAALGSALQPLAAAVADSTSLADLERRLRLAVPTLSLRESSAVAQGILVTSALNAASRFRER